MGRASPKVVITGWVERVETTKGAKKTKISSVVFVPSELFVVKPAPQLIDQCIAEVLAKIGSAKLRAFRVGGQAFVRTKDLGAIARRHRQGIARGNKCSAGSATHHVGAGSHFASQLIAHGFDFFDGGFQVRPQPQDGFQHVDNKAESQKDQNRSKNESQFLPPGLFGCIGVFRAVVKRGFVSSANTRLRRFQIFARPGDDLRSQTAAGFHTTEQPFRFGQIGF